MGGFPFVIAYNYVECAGAPSNTAVCELLVSDSGNRLGELANQNVLTTNQLTNHNAA